MLRNSTLLLDVRPNSEYHNIKHFQPNIIFRECSTCLAHREEVITLLQLHPLQMAHAVWITALLVLLLWTWFELSVKHWDHKSILLLLRGKENISKRILCKMARISEARGTFYFASSKWWVLNLKKKKKKRGGLWNKVTFFLLNSYIRKKISIGTVKDRRQTVFSHILYRSPGMAIVLKKSFTTTSGRLRQIQYLTYIH